MLASTRRAPGDALPDKTLRHNPKSLYPKPVEKHEAPSCGPSSGRLRPCRRRRWLDLQRMRADNLRLFHWDHERKSAHFDVFPRAAGLSAFRQGCAGGQMWCGLQHEFSGVFGNPGTACAPCYWQGKKLRNEVLFF